jgi:hypothetical protein
MPFHILALRSSRYFASASVREKDKLLVERYLMHHFLEVEAMLHCTLPPADIAEFIGGGLAHSIDDASNNVRRQFFMPNGIHNCPDVDIGKHHVLTREVNDAEVL